MYRIIPFIVVLTISFALPAQKKGIFDVFYEDDDIDLLDELPTFDNKKDYEIVYDTRQKGDENYRLHIDGVHVVMNSEPQVSSDLLEAVEAMYGMGGSNNEEISFIIGGAPSLQSSTTNKEVSTESITAAFESEHKEDEKRKETDTPKSTEKIDVTTTKAQNDSSSLKRNTDFIKRR